MTALLSKFWYIPLTIIVILIGLLLWNRHTIAGLKEDKAQLEQQVAAANLQAENNEKLRIAADEARADALKRQHKTEEFLKVIRNAPESENGPIALVLKRALTRLSETR